MAKPLELTEGTIADLEELIASLARENYRAALSLVESLEHTFLFLSSWPLAGHRKHQVTQDKNIRFWTANGDSIVYEAIRRPILIFCVLHGARDLTSVLTSRLEQR